MFFNRFQLIGLFISLSLLGTTRCALARLPQDEAINCFVDGCDLVDALNEMARKMGATNWTFTSDSCGDIVGPAVPTDPERNITCDCGFENNTCHVTLLEIKRFSLPGELPPELSRLRYLESIDFAYNYLDGSIPREWASMQLKSISLLANRLSGNIPTYLGNFTSLTYLNLELNQFSGTIPPELGKLVNLKSLMLSSNNLSGNLPMELSGLNNLTDFRINDNNLNGSIPDFMQKWKQLTRLEMQASGLQGPIPSSISTFENLRDLRISDINAMEQAFPNLRNSTSLRRLVLRKCNITGEIPSYIWALGGIRVLDLSFNNLHGPIPSETTSTDLVFLFLTGNSLSGNIPFLRSGINVDLSYNNFTRQSPEQPGCQKRENLNLFRSSSMGKDIGGACVENFSCQRYWHSLYINCGGENVKIDGKDYMGDGEARGGAAVFHPSDDGWGFSSTGDFMDNNDDQNKPYTVNLSSSGLGELYRTARLSPISLTYYHHCLENENYTVSLHFAEIQFRNDGTYYDLGRRIFNIYIQNDLVEKDFDIEVEASGAMKPFTQRYNASVTNRTLEIRFYWAGKGTTRIPDSGYYGPLISAISVDPNFKPPSGGGSTNIAGIVGGALGFCLLLLVLSILWWRHHSRAMNLTRKDFEGTGFQTVSFTLRQIKAATNNFDSANKIGEGGFGPVYKGLLADGAVVAVKQLSSKSSQGNREFLNEIGMISCLQHPNLVRLHGCCIEGDQLLLVYEYMENNSLARVLFEPGKSPVKLDWETRQSICLGIAKGLAFLHEESRLKIVHRDIKATNVLLDKDLKPKISDFGLAKLDDNDKTHISTRVAGTIGYMAPEYALWGYLTDKADIYSFGVVALEIVSGKHNISHGPDNSFACLLDWACHLQQRGELLEIVDNNLGTEFNMVEAERMIKVALLCTNGSPTLRPIMSDVVSMLEGTSAIPEEIPEADSYNYDLRFKAIRDHRKILNSQNTKGSLSSDQNSSSVSAKALYAVNDIDHSSSMSFPSVNASSSMSS